MKFTLSLLILCTTPALQSSDYKTIKICLFAACEIDDSKSFEKYAKKAKKELIEPLFLRRKGKTLLHCAAKNNSIIVCKSLLKKHKKQNLSTTNPTTKGRNTPLHLAAGNGNIEVVNLLLKYNGFTREKNKQGKSPLQRALLSNHIDVAEDIINYAVTQKPTFNITLSESAINKILDKNVDKGVVVPSDMIHAISRKNKIAFF